MSPPPAQFLRPCGQVQVGNSAPEPHRNHKVRRARRSLQRALRAAADAESLCGTLSEMAERRPCKFEGQPVWSHKARRTVTAGDFADLREIDTNRRCGRAKRGQLRGR